MRPVSKKTRQLVLGSAVILAILIVWWAVIYSPLRARTEELAVDLNRLSSEHERLIGKLKRLSETKQNSEKAEKELARFSGAIVEGQSLEEINAVAQVFVQEFLDGHKIPIKAYKEVTPSKWRQYALGRVEIQLNATTQGVSDLLYFFENLNKIIRIERLSIISLPRRVNDLKVSLRLGTLLLKEGNNETRR